MMKYYLLNLNLMLIFFLIEERDFLKLEYFYKNKDKCKI